jgi:cytochrome c peroxidase
VSRVRLIGSAGVAVFMSAISIQLDSEGAPLGNLITPPVAPLSAVVVPDVNTLGILDKSGPNTDAWPKITNAGQKIPLQQLGKALFWDMQLGRNGIEACASCHYHAGADHRAQNTGPAASEPALIAAGAIADLANGSVSAGALVAHVPPSSDTVQRVEPRNPPTVVNAIYNFRNLWDGRADPFFNGVNPLGFRDPSARVKAYVAGALVDERLRIPFSSLASQAVGPPPGSVEVHWDASHFAQLGKKMTRLTTIPLAGQAVATDDSLLGGLSAGHGLSVGYATLIRQVFDQRFWGDGSGRDVCLDADGAPDGTLGNPTALCATFSLMQWNFALFFGLSIQAYEATLTSDNTIVDLINGGVAEGVVSNGLAGRNLRTVNVGPPTGTTPAGGALRGLSLDECIAALAVGLDPGGRGVALAACGNHYARFITPGAITGTESATAPTPVPAGAPIGGCQFPLTCVGSPNQANAVATLDNVSRGMGRFFAGATGCAACHFNPEFNANTVSALTGFGAAPLEPLVAGQLRKIASEAPMERMVAFNGLPAVYDSGFYNLGIRPSPEDASLGEDVGGVPLSLAKLAEAINGGSRSGLDSATINTIAGELAAGNIVRIPTSALNLAPRPFRLVPACGPGVTGGGHGARAPHNNPNPRCATSVIPNERILRNGAFHTQGLRNVKYTGPYFHNGSKASLRQLLAFYKTAGHFTTLNLNNLDAGLRFFTLAAADESALVEFMETGLTDWRVAYERSKFDHPQICVPNGHAHGQGDAGMANIPAVGAGGSSRLVTFEDHLARVTGGHDLTQPCPMAPAPSAPTPMSRALVRIGGPASTPRSP